MRNCKFINLFLRRCLSISVDTGRTAQASVNCQQHYCLQWLPIDAVVASVAEDRLYHLTSVVSAVAHLMTVLNYSNHYPGLGESGENMESNVPPINSV